MVVEEAPAARAEPVDLMEALEASLKAARSRGDRNKALEQAAERLTEEAQQEQPQGDTGPPKRSAGARAGSRRASANRTKRKGSGRRKSA